MTTLTSATRMACTRTLSLAQLPALLRMRRALTEHLTHVWPTRRKAITPPAMAGLTTLEALALDVPITLGGPATRVLTVFLPADFREHVHELGTLVPRLRVHPDTSLTAQGAYASWETAMDQPPLTLWVEARIVLEALTANREHVGFPVLPMLIVAGDTVVLTELGPDEDWPARAKAAIEAARVAPSGLSEFALKKASKTAEKYSERPWLFMRYELKNGTERLAVNWAPVQRMHATPQD